MFAIGVSYESKDRKFVRNVVEHLEAALGKERVFVDFEKSPDVWGQNSLYRLFADDCEFVVPFCSSKYWDSKHCKLEWAAIEKRLSNRKGIPVRVDMSPIPGWKETDICISKGRKTGKGVAAEILEAYYRSTSNGKDADLVYGFLIVADVSDFSSLPSHSFKQVTDLLWTIPESLGLLDGRFNPISMGLLDGMMIALPQNITHRQLLEFGSRWISELRNQTSRLGLGDGVKLRVAIHHGGFYRHPDRGVILGVAPNECSRLVRMAPAGHIVVSEGFVASWRNEEEPSKIIPTGNKEPIGIQIKPGKMSYFRYYDLPEEAPFPESLRNAHDAEKLLYIALQGIEEEFTELIIERSGIDGTPILRASTIDTRVSIFVLDREGAGSSELRSTRFRVMRGSKRAGYKVVEEGQTRYSVGGGKAEGTVGKAFVTREVKVLCHLPNYKKDRVGYLRMLASVDVPSEKVTKFSRHARCFVAIPFWMHGGCTSCEGVVCVDTKAPLEEIPPQFIADCAEHIGIVYGPLISALIRLRG